METKTDFCRLCPCKILVVSHPTMAIRPWLGEPCQTFCQPAGLAQPALSMPYPDPTGRHNACRGDEVPRVTMLPTAESDPKGRHNECRSDAPGRESFAGHLTYAKIPRNLRQNPSNDSGRMGRGDELLGVVVPIKGHPHARAGTARK
jgi:hypothetical protein